MTGNQGEVDLEQARLDPASVFSGPEELHDHPGLARDQKIELLRRWAYDASELAVKDQTKATIRMPCQPPSEAKKKSGYQ